jgi:hypothetical protein
VRARVRSLRRSAEPNKKGAGSFGAESKKRRASSPSAAPPRRARAPDPCRARSPPQCAAAPIAGVECKFAARSQIYGVGRLREGGGGRQPGEERETLLLRPNFQ